MNETVELIRGLKYRKNNNGYAVLELKYTADPDKDPERNGAEWYKNAKEGMSSDEWEQEYEINYQIKIGKRVFPDFTEKSICKLIYNPHKPLLIGWDFGFRAPAVLFAQWDDEDRLCILKERQGEFIDRYQWIESVIKFIFDKFEFKVLEEAKNRSKMLNFCDPAGVQHSEAAKDRKSSVEVLRSYGFFPKWNKKIDIMAGLDLVHRLLRIRPDGSPALLVDPSCTILIEGFKGGYRMPENGGDKPEEDGYYEHLMDCMRYICVNQLRPVTFNRQKRERQRDSEFHVKRRRFGINLTGY